MPGRNVSNSKDESPGDASSFPWQAVCKQVMQAAFIFQRARWKGMMVLEWQAIRARILVFIALFLQIRSISVSAQDLSLEQKITGIVQKHAGNKAELVGYTWRQQEIIKVKGKIEDQRLLQVDLGADGRAEKMPLDLPEYNPLSQKEESRGMRDWIVQKKKHAVQQYARQLKELAESYAEAAPDLLQSAYERQGISIKSGAPGLTQLLIHDYLKPGDVVILACDEKSSDLQHLEVLSYIASTKEPVEIQVKFSLLPNGPDCVEEIGALNSKRKLSVLIRRLDYHRRQSGLLRAATIASF
jgi:hypothetical protein